MLSKPLSNFHWTDPDAPGCGEKAARIALMIVVLLVMLAAGVGQPPNQTELTSDEEGRMVIRQGDSQRPASRQECREVLETEGMWIAGSYIVTGTTSKSSTRR